MLEKIFAILFVSAIGALIYYNNLTYEHSLREYYYCTPYNTTEDPPLPPLRALEINNFEINYPDFSTKYKCELKRYTQKQFYIMRKVRK
jgi:hypothetical protein